MAGTVRARPPSGILPDNDGPGEKHAAQVSASLSGVAACVRVLRLPNLPEGGDPFDWIAAGGTAEKLSTWRGQTIAAD
jgi:putative DNA primase/helicase